VCALWHVDLLLGNDHEISKYTTGVNRQQSINNNRGMLFFCAVHAELL
jgi:hypothetical protein